MKGKLIVVDGIDYNEVCNVAKELYTTLVLTQSGVNETHTNVSDEVLFALGENTNLYLTTDLLIDIGSTAISDVILSREWYTGLIFGSILKDNEVIAFVENISAYLDNGVNVICPGWLYGVLAVSEITDEYVTGIKNTRECELLPDYTVMVMSNIDKQIDTMQTKWIMTTGDIQQAAMVFNQFNSIVTECINVGLLEGGIVDPNSKHDFSNVEAVLNTVNTKTGSLINGYSEMLMRYPIEEV